ncbi:MAG: Ig-like domain-containing protein, partial [Peptococcaceae bacterium]|nr:Ig-like domain-containing protein [Peptococcaceae bacterium]
MNNKTRKWRSAIAMVLVISMLFSIFPTAAFAEEPETEIKYVSLGDSMSNGYGLDGYKHNSGVETYADVAYPNLFANWLEGQDGIADVDHAQLAMSGIRVEDVHWLLELDYNDQDAIDLINDLVAINNVDREAWDQDEWNTKFSTGDYWTLNEICNHSRTNATFAHIAGVAYETDVCPTHEALIQLEDYPETVEPDGTYTMGEKVAVIAKYYQDHVKDADIVSLAVANGNLGVFGFGRILEAIGFDDGETYKNYDLEAALRECDPALQDEAQGLINEMYATIESATGIPVTGEDMMGKLADIAVYIGVSMTLNYAGTIDAVLQMNPDAEIIMVPVMNTFGEESVEVDGITLGDLMDVVVTPMNAFLAALPTVMQEAGNDVYKNAIFYYAEPEFVECMVEKYGYDFYYVDENENGNFDADEIYASSLAVEKARGNIESTTRDRFVEDIVGKNGSVGMIWGLMSAVELIDSVSLVPVTVAEIVAYEEMNATEKAFYAKNNKAKAVSISVYLAFEDAIVSAGGSTAVTLESVLGLGETMAGGMALFSNVMNYFNDNIVINGATQTSEAATAVAAIANDLQNVIHFTPELVIDLVVDKDNTIFKMACQQVGSTISKTPEEIAGLYESDDSVRTYVDNAVNSIKGQITPYDLGGQYELICTLLAVPQTLSDALQSDTTVTGLLSLLARCKIGNGLGAHPSAEGHKALADAVIEAYETGYTAQDKTIENLKVALNKAQDIIAEYYDEAYAYAYTYAKDAGYIGAAVAGIDGVIAALNAIDLSNTEMTDDFKIEVNAEITEIIETLEAAKALITEADVLDDATFNALMALLNEAGEDIEQLVVVLEQAGVDVNTLVIIPALNTAYDKLINEVVPAIVADLEEAIAEGTAWLMEKAQDAIDAVIEALPDMAEFAHDYVYNFLLNNPEDVIAFFTAYGDEIIDVVGEYGEYALAAMGYIAVTYDQEILNFVMENHEEILEVTAMLLKEHGPHAAELIKVYAEETGLCALIQDEIDKIEDQIADLREQLEEELYKQLAELEKQLDDLYAALEDAAGDVAEEIQAAIDAIEDVIAEVEAAIEAIEAAIADLEAQLAEAQKALEEAIAAVEAVVEAIKAAIENGVETVEEILAAIDAIVDFAEETIAGVQTAIEGIVNAAEDVAAFVEELIANGIVAAEMIEEIIDTVMDIIDGVKAELEKGDIEAAIEEIRNQLTAGYEELQAMLAAIDAAIAEQLDAIVGDLEAALAQAQDEFEEALYNATHGELACDAKTIAVYGGETVATEDGYAAIVAEEWGLTQTEAVDMADVILYQADPQIFVTALLDSVSGDYAANWAKYIGDEAVLAYLEQAKAELKDVLADEYGEEAAAVAEPLVDSFLFAVVEYAIANIETIEYLSRINEDALIVAAGMYNPVQGLSVTYGGETIDIEAMCQYLIEVTDVYNLLYAIAAQNAVFVDVSEAEAAAFDNVDVDSLLARAMALKAEAIALFAEAQKALEENDFNKASALMEQANALYTEIDNIVSEVLPLVESLDSSYATEAGHAYIAAQILAAIEKADHECEWAIDDNEHCYYCVNCGEEFVCGAHEFDGEEDTVCDVCGYERIIIDPTPEITTSSIVVYYLNENNAAIKDTTVREITTTGSYRFDIPDPIVFNGVEYLFNSLIDKDASDSYEAELEEGRFFVDVDVMPTTSSVLEFVLKYISEATVASIEISSTDHKTNYYVGDALDVTNLKLLVTYTNSQFNYVNVTPAMISGFDTTTAGEKTVTITYEGATTQYTITVSDPGGQGGPICVRSVAITPDSVSLKVGNTEALTANITPANAQIASVVWTSDNDAVATVDQNGVVTAVAKGNATITVTVTDVDDCVETATC